MENVKDEYSESNEGVPGEGALGWGISHKGQKVGKKACWLRKRSSIQGHSSMIKGTDYSSYLGLNS